MTRRPHLSPRQMYEVKNDLRDHFGKYIIGGIGIAITILGFSIWQGVKSVQLIVERRIAQQFEEPHIEKIVTDVAIGQAKEILNSQINPSVKIFEGKIKTNEDDFRRVLGGIEKEFSEKYAEIELQLAKIKDRNDISQLAAQSISEASASAFETLLKIEKETTDSGIKSTAGAELMRIKIFWDGASRVSGITLPGIKPDGSPKNSKDFTTDELIDFLQNDKDAKLRVIAAKALRNRKEDKAVKALAVVLKNDSDLEVRANAVRSFCSLTRVTNPDVFEVKDDFMKKALEKGVQK